MINEVLYMEMRLFHQYCSKNNTDSASANAVFKRNNIWNYIEECYDTLHLCGDEYILNEISDLIAAREPRS